MIMPRESVKSTMSSSLQGFVRATMSVSPPRDDVIKNDLAQDQGEQQDDEGVGRRLPAGRRRCGMGRISHLAFPLKLLRL
jgi:hypothetical protein